MIFVSLAAGRDPFCDPELPQGLKRRLVQVARPSYPDEAQRLRSVDGTTKLLLRLEAGDAVESVLIPEPTRTTMCVSSQVGCVRGCTFCQTATMGLIRNLGAEEIIAQVHLGLRVVEETGMSPLRNLVFMGMGEPLDNWTAVRGAIDCLVHPRGFGFGPRHLTLSTVAPTPSAVARLEGCPTRIAWSLHAGRDSVRRSVVQTQRHSVEDLRDAFKHLFSSRKDPLFVEMTLMDGINDRPEDAEAALRLFHGFPSEVRFNLLPMNPMLSGSSMARLAPSTGPQVQAFSELLRSAGYFTMVRAARGTDARAACGQLAVRKR